MGRVVSLSSYMPKSKSDTHLTPDEVHDVIDAVWGLDSKSMFDPCPAWCIWDALQIDWENWNYVNPPYGRLKGQKETLLHQFVMKAIKELKKGHKSIMLLPSKTDQDWFHELINWKFEINWFNHRLRFKNHPWSATQPHFLVRLI